MYIHAFKLVNYCISIKYPIILLLDYAKHKSLINLIINK